MPEDDLSYEDWQTIKRLATRLSVLKNLLDLFHNQVQGQWFADELKHVHEQLEADFNNTLNGLIQLIEKSES